MSSNSIGFAFLLLLSTAALADRPDQNEASFTGHQFYKCNEPCAITMCDEDTCKAYGFINGQVLVIGEVENTRTDLDRMIDQFYAEHAKPVDQGDDP